MIKKFNKLVRDKIPDIINMNGGKAEIRFLNDDEYISALENKLMEECKEVISAKEIESKKEELADVLEVIYSISSFFGISFEEIEKIRKNKRILRGGFESKTFLECVMVENKDSSNSK